MGEIQPTQPLRMLRLVKSGVKRIEGWLLPTWVCWQGNGYRNLVVDGLAVSFDGQAARENFCDLLKFFFPETY